MCIGHKLKYRERLKPYAKTEYESIYVWNESRKKLRIVIRLKPK